MQRLGGTGWMRPIFSKAPKRSIGRNGPRKRHWRLRRPWTGFGPIETFTYAR